MSVRLDASSSREKRLTSSRDDTKVHAVANVVGKGEKSLLSDLGSVFRLGKGERERKCAHIICIRTKYKYLKGDEHHKHVAIIINLCSPVTGEHTII